MGILGMKLRMLKILRLFLISSLLSIYSLSCVSVKIPMGDSGKTRSSHVQFVPPPSPFSSIQAELADQQWTSARTGNSISFLSECKIRNEPSLEVLEKEVLSALDQVVVKRESLIFNEREALRIRATGKLDGVGVEIDSLIFKRNTCSYTLTFGGRKGSLASEQNLFDKFLKEFKAP